MKKLFRRNKTKCKKCNQWRSNELMYDSGWCVDCEQKAYHDAEKQVGRAAILLALKQNELAYDHLQRAISIAIEMKRGGFYEFADSVRAAVVLLCDAYAIDNNFGIEFLLW